MRRVPGEWILDHSCIREGFRGRRRRRARIRSWRRRPNCCCCFSRCCCCCCRCCRCCSAPERSPSISICALGGQTGPRSVCIGMHAQDPGIAKEMCAKTHLGLAASRMHRLAKAWFCQLAMPNPSTASVSGGRSFVSSANDAAKQGRPCRQIIFKSSLNDWPHA